MSLVPPPPTAAAAPADDPGVPRLRTWRGVYGFVLACFAVMVGLLAWFTHAFAP
ncbi:hypothetical protein [Opitutus sp. ER46]|uniref:hypothetical protein n=1 Tax=Opitutus sp. ER46 TaxID=2161864 RepID=UPI00130496C8|nr:hypothetical protein [Opitutus sp. ER46]